LSLAAASISLSTGCGVDVSVGGTTGTGGNDSGSGGASSSAVTGTGGATSSATSSTGTGSGAVCGGFAGAVCADNEYCDFPDNRCGATDGQGICKPRPEACDLNFIATCGCDGQVHGNECAANSAGQDVSNMGSCQAPVGQFACGSHFCFQKTEYCTKFGSDVGSEPDTFSCKPVPAGCGATPTCACLSGVACGNICEATNGGLQVTCLGG
jgi:hypothetical protein